MGSSRLGSILVSEGLLTERDRSTIQISSGSSPYSFAKTILAMGLLDDDELASLLAARTKFPIAPKNLLEQLQFEALECLPHDVLLFMDVLPIRLEQKTLIVAVPDPLDQDITKQLQFFTGFKVKPMIAPLSQIRAGLERLQDSTNSHTSPFESFIENHATNASQRVTLARIGAVANPGAEQPVDQAKKKSEKVVAKNINQSAKSSTAKNSDDEFPLESNELSKDLGEDLVAVEDNDLPDVDPLIEVGAATNDLPSDGLDLAADDLGESLMDADASSLAIESDDTTSSEALGDIDIEAVDFGNAEDLGDDNHGEQAVDSSSNDEGDDLLALSTDENNLLAMDSETVAETPETGLELGEIDASMQQSFVDDELTMTEAPSQSDDMMLTDTDATDAILPESDLSGLEAETSADELATISNDISANELPDDTSETLDELSTMSDSSETEFDTELGDIENLEEHSTEEIASISDPEPENELTSLNADAPSLNEEIEIDGDAQDTLRDIPISIAPNAALAALNASILRMSAINSSGNYLDRIRESLQSIFPQGLLYQIHDTKLETIHQWGQSNSEERDRFAFADDEIIEMLQSLEPNRLITLPQLDDKASDGNRFCGSAFGSADDQHFIGIFSIEAYELENEVFNEVFAAMLETLASRSVA